MLGEVLPDILVFEHQKLEGPGLIAEVDLHADYGGVAGKGSLK